MSWRATASRSALAGDVPLGAIPIMGVIAVQTVQAMLLGAW